jgi:hypothetical protein
VTIERTNELSFSSLPWNNIFWGVFLAGGGGVIYLVLPSVLVTDKQVPLILFLLGVLLGW